MDFDLILDEIGEFGKFQLTNYILICLPVFYGAANSLSYVFTARSPKYRCLVPECDRQPIPNYNEEWVKDVLPGSVSGSTGNFVPDNCFKYNINNENTSQLIENVTCSAFWFDSSNVRCNKWVFDEGERTIVNDWPEHLACTENQWKLALVGSMGFAGIVVGSAVLGTLADFVGRKKVFISSIVFMSLMGIGQALASNYERFLFFTFLNAVGISGVYPLGFILGVEMVGKRKREMAGVVLNYFYSLGEALVGVIAWLDGDWVNLQYWVSAPPILFVAYYWIIPESARWLLARKKNRKAFKIIQQAAKNNGASLPQNIVDKFSEELLDESKHIYDASLNIPSEDKRSAAFVELIKSRILVTRCLLLFFIWGTNAFVFYGLSLNSVNLSGNIHLNFILGSLIEIPGNTIAWFMIDKIGRRTSLTSSLLICGALCSISAFIPENIFWIQIILCLTGKMAITSSYTIIFIYSAEMMPTIIRSGSVGAFTTFSRFVGLAAPFVPLLAIFSQILPLLVFGVFAFMAGLLAIFLPETLGRKLPDTIQDAIDIG